jgi:hypothetical protein
MSIPPPMFCANCGTRLESGSNFCEECGTPVTPGRETPAPAPFYQPANSPQPAPFYNPPPHIPHAANPPSPARKRNPLRLLMSIAGTVISCGLLAVGGYTLLKSSGALEAINQYHPSFLSNQPAPASQPTVKPPLLAAAPTAVLVANPQNGAPISVDMLSNLFLTNGNLPEDWAIQKSPSSGQTNGQWVNGMKNSEVYLKTLNDMGRITNIVYIYTAQGDPCAKTKGALWFRSSVDVFKQVDGAKKYYTWDAFKGKKEPGIGEQSVYSSINMPNKYRSCSSQFTSYTLMFQRLNTIGQIHMEALTGALSIDGAEQLVLEYGRMIDGRIIVHAQ